ncbi:conserved hypothetical protein [Nitrobacter winogradskyi Nb-255]|uniref:Bacteriophage-related protein n=2 Tax=Nitrobacter winogradskyi TaxID=913 RepID=Q3SR79_NITWN|nr:conserved hypothetical protein [Nitrobacter winogradskyi Nb-255]
MQEATKRTETIPRRPRESTAADENVVAQLAALKRMTVVELKAKWESLLGTPAPNNSRSYLELRLGYRIQELTLSGLSRETRRTLDLLADEIEGRIGRKTIIADPRNPVVGTRLMREWDGVEHTVTVMKDGFDWQGRKFKSLSAVARAITGTQWNGYRFFGLREARRDDR